MNTATPPEKRRERTTTVAGWKSLPAPRVSVEMERDIRTAARKADRSLASWFRWAFRKALDLDPNAN